MFCISWIVRTSELSKRFIYPAHHCHVSCHACTCMYNTSTVWQTLHLLRLRTRSKMRGTVGLPIAHSLRPEHRHIQSIFTCKIKKDICAFLFSRWCNFVKISTTQNIPRLQRCRVTIVTPSCKSPSRKSLIRQFFYIEYDVAILWWLQGLCGCYGIYIPLFFMKIALRGSYMTTWCVGVTAQH